MFSKKTVLILFFLVGISIFLFIISSFLNKFLRTTGLFASTKTEKDLSYAINNLIKGGNKVFFEVEKENTCYWVRPTTKKGKNYLEVNEYKSKEKNCLGILSETTYIELDREVNMISSNNCLCSGNVYLIELSEDGIKISLM